MTTVGLPPSIYPSIPIPLGDLLHAIREYVKLIGKKVLYNDFSFAATAWGVLWQEESATHTHTFARTHTKKCCISY